LGLDGDIEASYIPMLVLRNHFGSGHVSLALYDTQIMTPIYKYLEFAEDKFRVLLQRVVRKVADEGYQLRPSSDAPDKGKILQLNQLAASMSKGLPILPWEKVPDHPDTAV